MRKSWLFLPLLLLFFLGNQGFAQCNGYPELCALRYDQVVNITTHNAFNYEGAFSFPNQSSSVAQQLEDGVRGLMLDVYYKDGDSSVALLYHSFSFLGTQPLTEVLADIKTFLDDNPNEVVTLILECYVKSDLIESSLDTVGLIPYLHAQPPGFAWPTLQSMIDSGHRLVILSDNTSGPAFSWYHKVWDYAVETDFSNSSRGDFSCEFNRGEPDNDLFILNHFITHPSLGYGLIDSATAINAVPYILDRAMACSTETGKVPNFLTIDFHDEGQAFLAASILNGTSNARNTAIPSISPIETIGPNPVQDQLQINFRAGISAYFEVKITTINGVTLWQTNHHSSSPLTVSLNPSKFASGFYLLKVYNEHTHFVTKIMVQ